MEWQFHIARELGKTVTELGAIPESEFHHWIAYFRRRDRERSRA